MFRRPRCAGRWASAHEADALAWGRSGRFLLLVWAAHTSSSSSAFRTPASASAAILGLRSSESHVARGGRDRYRVTATDSEGRDVKDILLLKEALPYLRRHRRRTMIVKLGGEIADNDAALASLAQDLSLLVHVNIRIVVVHGGGPQATELSKKLGLTPVMVEGRRVTDTATLEVTKMVFAGQINMELLSVR